MRHPAAILAGALAGLVLVGSASAAPGAKKADVNAKAAPVPTGAQIVERRTALLENIEGWRSLSRSEGGRELAGALDAIRSRVKALQVGKDLKAASAALEAERKAFDAWRERYLAQAYEARHAGRTLQGASRDGRQAFTELTEKRADTLRQLAHRSFPQAPDLAAVRTAVLQADSAASLNKIFDAAVAASASQKLAFARQSADVAGSPSSALESAFSAFSRSRTSAAAWSFNRTAYAQPVSSLRISAPPAPGFSMAAEVAGAGQLEGAAAKGDKKSWQAELLKRTGAWSLLAAVGVDPMSFLRALTGAESGYATNATSSAGAAGVMQVMPDTARGIMLGNPKYRQIAREYGLKVYSAGNMSNAEIQRLLNSDWRTNILLGILYIDEQARAFGGRAKAAAVSMADKAKLMMNMIAGAYNAGPGRVWSALRSLGTEGLAAINPAQSLVRIRETQNYVKTILRNYGSWLFAANRQGEGDRARG